MDTTRPCRTSPSRLLRVTTRAAVALFAAAAVTLPMSAAHAAPAAGGDVESPGCVSNAEYARLAIGTRLHFVRSVVGDDAQTSVRRWDAGSNSYQERLYGMCTPVNALHGTLTARFMRWQGAWRAQIIDTCLGPE